MTRIVSAAVLAVAVASVPAQSAEERFASSEGAINITPLVHASIRIDVGPRTIYIDPWSAADLSHLPASDLIIVTDADAGEHHLDPAAIATLRAPGGTVVMPESGRAKVIDGTVLRNGSSLTSGSVRIDAIPAYDLTRGEPYHEKGVANGYVLTIGGTRVLVTGVTECVPEIRALQGIDVAFLPMNLPNGRMSVEHVAECVRAFKPRVVFPYHYDQGYGARLARRGNPTDGDGAEASVRALVHELSGASEVRIATWYPMARRG